VSLIDPAELVAELNAGLLAAGQAVRLQRQGTPAFYVDTRISLRGYSPTEIIPGSDITQQDQQFVLSPTDLIAAGWPGPGGSSPRAGDPLVPRNGDRIVLTGTGRALSIQAAAPIYVAGVLVRIDGRARG
jgi:hypothetical protein